jgi:uncharacterized membrane protein
MAEIIAEKVKCSMLLILLAAIFIIFPTCGMSISSLILRVYEDGVVHVEERIIPGGLVENITVSLLARNVENVMVLGGDGRILAYDIIADRLTIYCNASREVVIYYDTDALTYKNGSLWSLEIDLPAEATVILPGRSVIISLNNMPKAITSEGQFLKLILGPGYWKIEYVMRVGSSANQNTRQEVFPVLILAGSLGGFVTILSAIIIVKRYRRSMHDLSEDERRVLEIIRSKKRVSESDIRVLTHLPKTTVWRVVRRLERRGLVRVVKVGRRNEVELA